MRYPRGRRCAGEYLKCIARVTEAVQACKLAPAVYVPSFRTLIFSSLMALAACEGCKSNNHPGEHAENPVATAPTLRLYLVSDLAGALEPCGCVKDQLGGLDHFLAHSEGESKRGVPSATLAAGPLFFMDTTLSDDRKGQELTKAETLADGLKRTNLLAFAPAANDYALGEPTLATLATRSGAVPLGTTTRTVVREVGGIKIGLVGIGPKTEGAPEAAARAGYDEATRQGARIVIVLASIGRGAAKRVADAVPELTAVVVGAPSGGGETNTETPPGERLGNVLVAETGNHLQTVAVLDLTLRADGSTFADASNLDDKKSRRALDLQIKDLRTKIALAGTDKKKTPTDDAPLQQLASLRAERDKLDVAPAPSTGNFFRYHVLEVREDLGRADFATQLFRAYYKKVNDANKVAFADRKPREPAKGDPAYVGQDACVDCHEAPKKVWDKTAHAHAYATLSDQFKEFNLDCVSCHVTGYDKPGGSTVTAVKGLTDVQCEVCHGPGSKHAANPKLAMPVAKPGADSCLSCHHPPHVFAFDAASKLQEILGPGHGKPL